MFKKLSINQKMIITGTLATLALIYIIPMIWVIYMSFNAGGLQNYAALFQVGLPVTRMIFNSIIVAVVQVVLIVMVTSFASFSFSKLRFKGKSILYTLVVLSLTIPLISIITPLFLILRQAGMIDSVCALILPRATIWMPFAVIIQKNYYDSLPNELIESGKIDGASWLRIFYNIYFPMAKPVTINIIIFAFMNAWNDYLSPLLFIRTINKYTLPLAVSAVTGSIRGSRSEVVFACLVIMAIPSIIVYLALQKYFGEGMTGGAVKG